MNQQRTRKSAFGRREMMAAGVGLAGLAALPKLAWSQSWPSKPVRLIFPYPAGGNGDALARLVGAAIGKRIGQPVLMEFQPGANAAIGTSNVARAQPDGYTLLFTGGTPIVQNKLLRKNLPYDPQTDLVPIGKVGSAPQLIVVNPKLPVRNLQQLVAYAKEHPGKLNASTPGIGSIGQLSVLLLESAAGVQIKTIPYATNQRTIDLIRGEIDMTIDPPGPYLQYVSSGQLIPIAVMSARRSSALPDVPTTAESGFPGLEAEVWYGVFGPKRTPQPVVERVNEALAYFGTPEGQEELARQALEGAPTTPAGLHDFIQKEYEKWGAIIRRANLTLD